MDRKPWHRRLAAETHRQSPLETIEFLDANQAALSVDELLAAAGALGLRIEEVA